MHGMNWMLDLIDYEALDMARSTVELRREDRKRMDEGSGQGPSSFVVSLLLLLKSARAEGAAFCALLVALYSLHCTSVYKRLTWFPTLCRLCCICYCGLQEDRARQLGIQD